MARKTKSEENLSKECLKQFLLDIECLDEITVSKQFNPFDVLKISRAEIRHSNVLAWLLDPNENHGFETKILSSLIGYIVQNQHVDTQTAFDLLMLQYPDVQVKREWRNIDILIESKQEKFVICIENKVDTQDHSNQLDKYFEIIHDEESYAGFVKLFLYLTPDGLLPNEDSNSAWKIIKYADIIGFIEKELNQATLGREVRTFVEQYVEVLRRETMEDKGNNIEELCRKIYAKHKQALDLIFEYRPDMMQNAREIFTKWCENRQKAGEIIFDSHKSNKSYHRFRTEVMNSLIPDSDVNSEWNTKNHYYYEISAYMERENIKYDVHFVVNSKNLNQQEIAELEKICRLLCDQYNPSKNWNQGWSFITSVSSEKYVLTADGLLEEDSEERVMRNLDTAWNHVRKIEAFLLEQYKKQ